MKHRYLMGLFGLALVAGVEASNVQVSLDDIVLLNQRGLSDQTILLFLENRELGFVLSVEAIDKLLSNNVSEEIISYLLSQAATTKTVADASRPTNTIVVPVYPVVAYPAYYYAPYYYGASFSFGFANYPHAWFGHYSGAGHFNANVHPGAQVSHSSGGHVNQHNGHGVTHTATHSPQHGGMHAGGAIHSAVGGVHGIVHSGNSGIEHNKQHAITEGGRHGLSRGEQAVTHGVNRIGHSGIRTSANNRPHSAIRDGGLHTGAGSGNSHGGGGVHVGGSGGRHGGGRGH